MVVWIFRVPVYKIAHILHHFFEAQYLVNTKADKLALLRRSVNNRDKTLNLQQ